MRTRRISVRMLKREERSRAKAGAIVGPVNLPPLPTRDVCRDGPRPCPHVRCRYHLMTDVSHSGSLTLLDETGNVQALRETCALDVADRGKARFSDLCAMFGMHRNGVQKVIDKAIREVRQYLAHQGFSQDDVRRSLK